MSLYGLIAFALLGGVELLLRTYKRHKGAAGATQAPGASCAHSGLMVVMHWFRRAMPHAIVLCPFSANAMLLFGVMMVEFCWEVWDSYASVS